VKDRSAKLRIAIALSEFTTPAITRLPARPRQYPVPGVGHCSLDTIYKTTTRVSCVAPFEPKSAVDFLIQSHTGGKPWPSFRCAVWYAPIGTLGSFSAWTEAGSMSAEYLSPKDAVSIEMRRPVSFFEREISIADIQLSPYEVAR
jgi:hypothetical protein